MGYTTMGRETFLAEVTWEDDWPVVNPGNEICLTMVVDGLTAKLFIGENQGQSLLECYFQSIHLGSRRICWVYYRGLCNCIQ